MSDSTGSLQYLKLGHWGNIIQKIRSLLLCSKVNVKGPPDFASNIKRIYERMKVNSIKLA